MFRETITNDRHLWEMYGVSLIELANKLSNYFWADVLRSFANVSAELRLATVSGDLSRCSLWYSDVSKYRTECIDAWRKKGLCYLNDLVDNEWQILSFQDVKHR